MNTRPHVDVNLFVFNGAATIAETLDTVLTQTWPDLTVTVIDNASTDDTGVVVERIIAVDPRVSLQRNRVNIGPVLNCQRAFWQGGSGFVMPKTADDLLAPDFIAELMEILLTNDDVAMCHAAGLVFGDDRSVRSIYPPNHSLHATQGEPLPRARHVMTHYTSAPAFWGIYRRDAVERLAPLAYRPGWDHAMLAELALYGHIRSVEPTLFWRRHGGKDVGDLARGCSQFTQRGLELNDALADLFWHVPLVGTAYAHIERFAVARLSTTDRRRLMDDVPRLFRARWLPMMRQEAIRFRAALPALTDRLAAERGVAALWAGRQVIETLTALQALVPDEDFTSERIIVQALAAA